MYIYTYIRTLSTYNSVTRRNRDPVNASTTRLQAYVHAVAWSTDVLRSRVTIQKLFHSVGTTPFALAFRPISGILRVSWNCIPLRNILSRSTLETIVTIKKVRQNVTTAKSYLSSSKRARTHLPTIAFVDKSINRRKWKTRIRTYIFYLTTTRANRHSEVMFAVPSFRQQMFPIQLPVSRSPRWLSCRRRTKPGAEKKFKLSRR